MKLSNNILFPSIFIFFAFCSFAVPANDFKLKIGDVAPAYLGKNSQGDEVNLESLRGKITVISFWASWCPPCLKELPVLEKIQNQVGKDKLEVVAINYREPRKHFKKIKRKLSHLQLTLTHDRKGRISKQYGIKSLPHVLVIDKEGKVIYQNLGYNDEGIIALADKLNELLAS